MPINLEYTTRFTFKYLFSGRLIYRFESKDVLLKSGQFLLIRNHRQVKTSIEESAIGISIFFKDNLKQYLDPVLLNQPMPLLQSELEQSLIEVKHAIENGLSIHQSDVLSKIIKHLQYYSKLIRSWKTSMKYIKSSTSLDVLLKLMNARNIIEKRYYDPLDMDYISGQVAMSKYNFIRKFKEAFHITPQRLLLDKRISEAKKMLLNSMLSITEIASSCGFQNIHHFSKTFKMHVGISPSAFRIEKFYLFINSKVTLELQV